MIDQVSIFYRLRWLCLGLVLASLSTVRGEEQSNTDVPVPAPVEVDPSFESPRATMKTFLTGMHDDEDPVAQAKVLACLNLSDTMKERAELAALELLEVIDRLEYIDWIDTHLPDLAAVKHQNINTFKYFPHFRLDSRVVKSQPKGQIVFAKTETGEWEFSAETVSGSYELFRSLEHLPKVEELLEAEYVDASVRSLPMRLRQWMPASLKGADRDFFTLEFWQWLGLFIIILVGVVFDYSVRFVLRTISIRIIKRQGASDHAKAVRLAVRPVGLLGAAILWVISIQALGLPDMALRVLLGAARVFATLAGTLAAWHLTNLITDVLSEKAAQTDNRFDDVVVPLIRKSIKIFIIAIGLIYLADSLNISVFPLLTSLGIGGVAFAFAAKDTVENFFGSVAVLVDRPFEVGDWVVIDQTEGTVEEVGFRSTRIRTFYNSLVTVPNSNLVRAVVDNYGKRAYRRWKTFVGVQYDTPPDKLIAFTEGIRELVRTHPFTRKDYFQVYLNEFGPSALNILLYIFHEVPDWSTELRERERLFLDIVRLADQLGVQFAFPTQTIHLHQETSGQTHRAAELPKVTDDHQAQVSGIKAAQRLMQDQSWQKQSPGPVMFRGGPTPLRENDTSPMDQTSTKNDSK